jgi:hypothetical protein
MTTASASRVKATGSIPATPTANPNRTQVK